MAAEANRTAAPMADRCSVIKNDPDHREAVISQRLEQVKAICELTKNAAWHEEEELDSPTVFEAMSLAVELLERAKNEIDEYQLAVRGGARS